MYRSVSIASAVVALAVAATVALPAAAQATDDGCVDQQEYNALTIGMRLGQVSRTIGTPGTITSKGHGRQSRTYDICGISGAGVYLKFRHTHHAWRLTAKSADAE